LQVEQALQELTEETRLAEAKLQASQQELERETTLKRLESEFKLQVQQQEDALREQTLTATLARQRQESLARLDLEEAANRLKLALAEGEMNLSRMEQEIHNLVNNNDLAGRLIDRLPELAAHMPEIQELRVLQTGDGHAAADALTAFLAKMLTVAETLGISLRGRSNGQSLAAAELPSDGQG
jgi:hypothetical protein